MEKHPIKKTLIIITHPRSGSTLLMGILNTLKGACIRGENNNLLLGLFRSYKQIIDTKSEFDNTNSYTQNMPWFGYDEIETEIYARGLISNFTKNILSPPSEAFIIGFKEVRYFESFFKSQDELIDYVHFMNNFFINCHIIFLARDSEVSSKSSFNQLNKNAESEIRLFHKNIEAIQERLATKSLYLHYENINAELKFVPEIEKFLDVNFDKNKVKAILNIKHSY
jgi:hypothetical protein